MGASAPRKASPRDERRRPRQRAVIARRRRDHDTTVPPLYLSADAVRPRVTLAERRARSSASRPPRCAAGSRDGRRRRCPTASGRRPRVAHARIVARLRERGHSLDEIREATRRRAPRLRLHRGPLPGRARGRYTLEEAAEETGLEPALIERICTAIGLHRRRARATSPRTTSSSCATSPPCSPPASRSSRFLQLVRVYGQALAQIADAEVRLFHLYVHEPLMRDGVAGLEMAEEMEGLAARAAAARLADHGPRPPALPAALRRAGRHRPHGGRPRATATLDLGPPARGDRLRRPRRATRA